MIIDSNGRLAIVKGSGGGLGKKHGLALAKRGRKSVAEKGHGSPQGLTQRQDHGRVIAGPLVFARHFVDHAASGASFQCISD